MENIQALALTVLAVTGPIVEERAADVLLESFETDPAAYEVQVRGKVKHWLTARSGIAKHGSRSVLLGMDAAPAEKGRHTVLLRWRFDKPQDWSAYAGLAVWFQAHTRTPPTVRPIVYEASKSQYWSRTASLLPRQEGQWQLVKVPFKSFTWSWEAGQDPNGRLDLDGIVEVRFEIWADKEQAFSLGIDGLGLYRPRPPYAGPILRLRAPGNNKDLYVRSPGQDYRLTAQLRQLASGQRADVDLIGADYWGRRVFEKTLAFEGKAGRGDRYQQDFTFPNAGPNYVEVVGTVKVDGKPVYRAEQGVGCIVPLSEADAARNPDSMFGIWVNSDRRIGQKWNRVLVRLKAITKLADGRYQVAGCEPGVAQPGKWGWGDPELCHIACFVDMPKWLSSKPDRADWQKWSPTSWDEFGKLVSFMAGGAKRQGITHYEVWNEPVPFAYWMGPMESVVKLHEVTYKAIKRVQPEATVLGPCPYTFKWDFLEEYFRLGGAKWLDHVVVHAYDAKPPDASFAANLRKLRAMMERVGLGDRDVTITEMGYGTPQHTEREQARYMVRAFAYALSEGVRVFIWHMLWDWKGTRDPANYAGDPGHAIVRFERSPRPAYVAYAVMTRMLERAKYVGPIDGLSATQRGYQFEKDGRRVYVLWDTGTGPTTLALKDAAGALTVVDQMGGETTARPTRAGRFDVSLGPDVIYVLAE